MYMNNNYLILVIIIIILICIYCGYINSKSENKCTSDNTYYLRLVKDFNLERNYCDKNVTRIAFGSCNFQYIEPTILKYIVAFDPDLWIWLGDLLYLDKKYNNDNIENVTPQIIWQQYAILKNNQFLKEFKMYKIPTIGIWDDHDYYRDNAGYDIDESIYRMSKSCFLNFMGVKPNDIRYKRRGIYTTYTLKSKCKKYSAKIFLLDVRTFRTRMDILGRDQWNWLADELKKSCADINIIASGSQILASKRGSSWNGTVSRHKIINMLKCIKKYNTIFISGDMHYSSIFSYDNFIDVSASSLSAPLKKPKYKDPGLVGYNLVSHNFGFIQIEWSEDGKHKILTGFIDDKNKPHNVIQLIGYK